MKIPARAPSGDVSQGVFPKRAAMRPAATYSPNAELGVSTIGPEKLNCRVRNGNGCILFGNTTGLIAARFKGKPHVFSRPCRFSGARADTCGQGEQFGSRAYCIHDNVNRGLKNMAKPHGRLVPVTSTHCCAYSSGLSNQ